MSTTAPSAGTRWYASYGLSDTNTTLRSFLTLRSEALYHDPEIVPWLFWSCPKEALPDPAWLDSVLEFRELRRLFWDVQLTHPPELASHLHLFAERVGAARTS